MTGAECVLICIPRNLFFSQKEELGVALVKAPDQDQSRTWAATVSLHPLRVPKTHKRSIFQSGPFVVGKKWCFHYSLMPVWGRLRQFAHGDASYSQSITGQAGSLSKGTHLHGADTAGCWVPDSDSPCKAEHLYRNLALSPHPWLRMAQVYHLLLSGVWKLGERNENQCDQCPLRQGRYSTLKGILDLWKIFINKKSHSIHVHEWNQGIILKNSNEWY